MSSMFKFDPTKFSKAGASGVASGVASGGVSGGAADQTLRDATQRVTAWVKEMLPGEIKSAMVTRADHLMINCREVQCGDPSCSPVDVVVALLFGNGRRAMSSLPMTMQETRREDVARLMAGMTEELLACHADAPFTSPHAGGPPQLSPAGTAALEKIAVAINEAMVQLSQQDVLGVCELTMDLLEQIEEDSARPPAPPPRPLAGQPPMNMDPNTKILSAAQRNDIDAVRKHLAEGIPASYANSLGQTPLHIAAMWGNPEVLKLLLDHGADVDAANQLSSATPLHVAAASNRDVKGRLAAITILLDAGANPTALDADGNPPYAMALGENNAGIKDLLAAAFDDAEALSVDSKV